jgi:phage terminase small subunit
MSKEELSIYLTQQQKIFCYEYLKDFRIFQAYKRAGYKGKGRQPASAVRNKPEVDAFIELLIEEKRQSIEVDVNQVLKELTKIGFSDMGNYAAWKQRGIILRRSNQLTPEETCCIQSLTETKTGVKLALHPKLPALRMIGEYLRMFGVADADDRSTKEKAMDVKKAFDQIMKSVPTSPPGEEK